MIQWFAKTGLTFFMFTNINKYLQLSQMHRRAT